MECKIFLGTLVCANVQSRAELSGDKVSENFADILVDLDNRVNSRKQRFMSDFIMFSLRRQREGDNTRDKLSARSREFPAMEKSYPTRRITSLYVPMSEIIMSNNARQQTQDARIRRATRRFARRNKR